MAESLCTQYHATIGHSLYVAGIGGQVGKQEGVQIRRSALRVRIPESALRRTFRKATTQAGRCVPHPLSQVFWRALAYAMGCPEINDKRRNAGRQERPRPECTRVEGMPMASVHDSQGRGPCRKGNCCPNAKIMGICQIYMSQLS